MSDSQVSEAKITCQKCGAQTHAIQSHIKNEHPDYSLEQYKQDYPDAPLLSEKAKALLAAKAREKQPVTKAEPAAQTPQHTEMVKTGMVTEVKRPFHETFGLGKKKEALGRSGGPIPITVLEGAHEMGDLVPPKDENYRFPIEVLKDVIMGIELNIPTMLYGHMGTGKTTILEQSCHYTNRPFIRVQHTINTEEAHILGQTLVRGNETYFELGPLPVAMKYGLVFCADEYDFAHPSVLSVYQPVLEGKALVIKEADHANRIITPHPNFRFVATGNTNGVGDETGLYAGTNIQNAANYERFGIVRKVEYMPEAQEADVIASQAGVPIDDAKKLVKFAKDVRQAHDKQNISHTVSPRALINAAKLGVRKGSYRDGLTLSFSNRLSTVDKEVVDQFAQRIFG
jgi:cobaltochelatase CobS